MLFTRRKKTQQLERKVVEMQHTIDILAEQSARGRKSASNPYPSYEAKTRELDRKYSGEADWGNHLAHALVELRASFIIGDGIKPAIQGVEGDSDAGKRELEFIQAFIDRNNLDEEVPQDWAKEAEIEGKFLVRLWADKKAGQVDARFMPWTQHKYHVHTAPDDYASYSRVTYKPNGQGNERALEPHEFAYKRFYGRTQRVNETPSKVAHVLAEIEALDKALKDWREINHLFAAPTPYFKVADSKQGEALYDKLRNMGWRIGRFLVASADFSLVGPDARAFESIHQELQANAKAISGATGIPVHFLGLPELMSNRATADNLMELVTASTEKERHIWIGLYEELFSKVLAMANKEFQNNYRTDIIGCQIAPSTSKKLAELYSVWLPLFESRAISHETFLSHVPGIDATAELERLAARDADQGERMLKMLGGHSHAA